MVITEERVMELFAEDNPIPSVDDLDLTHLGSPAYLSDLEQRSSDMTQLDTKPSQNRKPTRGGWMWAMGVATATILIGGVLIITQNGDSQTDVAGPSATEIVIQMEGNLDALSGTFTATGGAVDSGAICSDGVVFSNSNGTTDGTYWYENQYVCANGNADFTMRAEIVLEDGATEFDASDGTWTILRGTRDYTDLQGSGTLERGKVIDDQIEATYVGEMTIP